MPPQTAFLTVNIKLLLFCTAGRRSRLPTFTDLGRKLLQTWQDLPRRPGCALPYWDDVRAGPLAPIMKHIWVMEFRPPASMIIRFLGSEVVRLSGRDTTGEDFLSIRTNPARRSLTMAIYRTAYNTPCATMLRRTLSRPGFNPRDMLSTFAPLASEGEGHWLLIGVTETIEADNLPEDPGIAAYTTAEMFPPEFVDIGFGVPEGEIEI
ncbi:MAG: PAS domain-containing protein [Alphaproteobacteria bacterium]|nr:MAG: PAS domain-containing protein [Alphaproteobacteria bacterium]